MKTSRMLPVSLAIAAVLVSTVLVRASNAGRTWERTSFPGDTLSSEIGRIVAHPVDPDTIYVPTTQTPNPLATSVPPGDGLFRTTDGGDTWTSINDGVLLPQYNVAELAVCRDFPDVMYAATLQAGIFKTVDAGATWSDISGGFSFGGSGFPNAQWGVLSVAVDPTNPDKVYMSVAQISGLDEMNPSPDHPGFYYSQDGGATWIENNSGLPARFDDPGDSRSTTAVAASIAVLPQQPKVVLLGMLELDVNTVLFGGRNATSSGRMFVSRRSGTDSFVEVSSGLASDVTQSPEIGFSLARASLSTLVLTVESGDDIGIWASHTGLTFDLGLSETVAVTRGRGVYYTADGSWEARNDGLPFVASWVDPASTAGSEFRTENSIATGAVAVAPGALSRVGLVGALRSDQGDASSNATKVYATPRRAVPRWVQNWDAGLDVSPTLGYTEANAAFLAFNSDTSVAFAAISWSDDDVVATANDDDGIYRLVIR